MSYKKYKQINKMRRIKKFMNEIYVKKNGKEKNVVVHYLNDIESDTKIYPFI